MQNNKGGQEVEGRRPSWTSAIWAESHTAGRRTLGALRLHTMEKSQEGSVAGARGTGEGGGGTRDQRIAPRTVKVLL